MAGTDDRGPQDIKKERGTGFPTLSLPEAAAIVRTAGIYGNQHPLSAMAGYAGHQTANSGPFRQKLAALKDWGFVAVSGDTVHLTPAAMELALPASKETEAAVLLKAFQGCALFWKVYNDLAKGVAIDIDAIANKAVTAYGVNVKAREKFATSFVHSSVQVDLAESLNNDKVVLLTNNEDNYIPTVGKTVDKPAVSTPALVEPPVAPVATTASKPVVSQSWEDSEASIIFEVRAAGPLSARHFVDVGRAVRAIEELWASMKTGPLEADHDRTDD